MASFPLGRQHLFDEPAPLDLLLITIVSKSKWAGQKTVVWRKQSETRIYGLQRVMLVVVFLFLPCNAALRDVRALSRGLKTPMFVIKLMGVSFSSNTSADDIKLRSPATHLFNIFREPSHQEQGVWNPQTAFCASSGGHREPVDNRCQEW